MDDKEIMTVDDVMQWLSDVIRGDAAYHDRLTAAKQLVEIYKDELARDDYGDDDKVVIIGDPDDLTD